MLYQTLSLLAPSALSLHMLLPRLGQLTQLLLAAAKARPATVAFTALVSGSMAHYRDCCAIFANPDSRAARHDELTIESATLLCVVGDAAAFADLSLSTEGRMGLAFADLAPVFVHTGEEALVAVHTTVRWVQSALVSVTIEELAGESDEVSVFLIHAFLLGALLRFPCGYHVREMFG